MSDKDKSDKTLLVTTVLVLLGVSMLAAFLFIMRSRSQGRWMVQRRTLRAQEWMRKMDELGIGVQPALHEVVVGGAKADGLGRDRTKWTWNQFMVGV